MRRLLKFNYVIGAGAMGTVYHAELRVPSGGFTRQCAVKVMKAFGPDQEHFRTRMRDEARLLGMLQDEQILGVSELVVVEGRDVVIMEYVDGLDLQELIKTHRVPPRALAELGAELAGALHRAHNARHPGTGAPLHVIHRDVKPANVMVTSRGGVRLLDFGVARAAFDARESHTQGLVLGTLNYFPPEILAGGDPTPSVDIYGLGLSLWECAAGRPWGSPQVNQRRFERRVEERLSEIQGEYHLLVPALRQMLHWSADQRADGQRVEQELLQAADKASGEGLRTWSRRTIQPLLQGRRRSQEKDELVGKQVPISAGTLDIGVEPEPLTFSPPPNAPGDATEETYNDLAPPAAVKRRSRRPEGSQKRELPADDAAAPGSRRPVVAAIVVAILGVLAVGVIALLVSVLLAVLYNL